MPAAAANKKRRFLRWSLGILAVAALTIALSSAWFYWQLKRSLPLLDGDISLASAGLSAPVTIERDTLGVPTIRAATRPDAARALGFLHAQERFFQMDLARRKAAGQLSALLGEGALDADRSARIHNFATIARDTLAQLPAVHRTLLEAYAAGANAGLSQLRARPFEYILLRSEPAPWKPEDSILVIHSMWLDLQDENGSYERSLAALRDRYGPAAANAFAPAIAPDDLALDGSTAPLAPLPTPRQLNLRQTSAASFQIENRKSEIENLTPGSNSLAVSGPHTATGAALLASDMHLALRVPNLWYRATLDFPAETSTSTSSLTPATRVRVTGVTLPGLPVIVAGSNGHIAWGFTNAHADTVDLVAITASDINPDAYYIHEGRTLEFPKRTESIAVRGTDPVTHEITLSPWGPVIGTNAKGQRYALKWLAHDPAATNLELLSLETATTTPAAVEIAHRIGIPTMNFLVADSTGAIAWTLAGKLPNRIGYDGRFPVTMSFGDRRWDGFVPENQIPVIDSQIVPSEATGSTNRESRIENLATANQRLLGGDAFTLIGDGGYPPAYRAARIHERLASVEKATPADLLAIQLDDRAPYLDRWQKLLVKTLTGDTTASRDKRAALLAAVSNWQGRASTDSASYTLVRSFRRHVIARALDPLFAHIADRHPDFTYTRFRYQPALDRLLEEQPLHLLASEYEAWSDLLLAAADDVLTDLKEKGLDPAEATWGRENASRIHHPLSRALPGFLAKKLNMPADPLPGDNDVPRVQRPAFGASQRFVVSPGRESEGLYHMPGGQSGHPLSPYYRAGHDAWVKGEPTPFLPGATAHTLTLTP